MILALCAHGRALAGAACDLPAVFSLTVEEPSGLIGGRGGLSVVRSAAPSSPLRPGDVIRQANDRRSVHCADLEGVAAETLAKGLVLLLAAERDGQLFAVAIASSPATVTVPPPPPPPAARGETAAGERGASPPPVAAPVAPLPLPTTTPIPQREVALPPRADASAELAAKAVAAAAVLGAVDEAARLTVPLAVYERRIEEARNAVAALHIEGEGSAAVRDVLTAAFGYHETARDIRRWKAEQLTHARVDQRAAAAMSLPYFSDSEVPRWVARYPFLGETLQQAPRATHMLLPGEMAGRWNPDQAVELLWDHAAKTAARLGAWGANK